MRGSIVDIYPLDADNPVRLDFFDTALDSLRSFDAETQRSLENLDSITILPATDLVIDADDLATATTNLEVAMTEARDKLDGADKRHLTEAMNPLLSMMSQGGLLPEIRQYLHILYPDAVSLLDYLPADGIAVFDDYPRALENADQITLDNQNWWTDEMAEQRVLPDPDLGWQLADLARDVQQASLVFSPLQRGIGQLRQTSLTNLTVRPAQQFFGQMPMLKSEVARWQKSGETIIFLTNTTE